MIVVYEWRPPKGWRQQSVHNNCDLTEHTAARYLTTYVDRAFEGQEFLVTKEIDHQCDYLTVAEFKFKVTNKTLEAV